MSQTVLSFSFIFLVKRNFAFSHFQIYWLMSTPFHHCFGWTCLVVSSYVFLTLIVGKLCFDPCTLQVSTTPPYFFLNMYTPKLQLWSRVEMLNIARKCWKDVTAHLVLDTCILTFKLVLMHSPTHSPFASKWCLPTIQTSFTPNSLSSSLSFMSLSDGFRKPVTTNCSRQFVAYFLWSGSDIDRYNAGQNRAMNRLVPGT